MFLWYIQIGSEFHMKGTWVVKTEIQAFCKVQPHSPHKILHVHTTFSEIIVLVTFTMPEKHIKKHSKDSSLFIIFQKYNFSNFCFKFLSWTFLTCSWFKFLILHWRHYSRFCEIEEYCIIQTVKQYLDFVTCMKCGLTLRRYLSKWLTNNVISGWFQWTLV